MNWQTFTLEFQVDAILQMDPSLIGDTELNTIMEYFAVVLSAGLIDGLSTTIINVFAMCLVSNYLIQKFNGNEPKLWNEIKKAFSAKLIGVLLLLGLGIALGSLLIYIPSIILLGFYSFSIFTYHSKEFNNSNKEARDIAKGSFWKIFGIFFITNLIISWWNPTNLNFGMIILYSVLVNLIEILLTPLFICLLTALYVHLKNKREYVIHYKHQAIIGPSREQNPYYQERTIPSTGNEEKEGTRGLYCPFCGKFMKVQFKFCPHCGKEINFEI